MSVILIFAQSYYPSSMCVALATYHIAGTKHVFFSMKMMVRGYHEYRIRSKNCCSKFHLDWPEWSLNARMWAAKPASTSLNK